MTIEYINSKDDFPTGNIRYDNSVINPIDIDNCLLWLDFSDETTMTLDNPVAPVPNIQAIVDKTSYALTFTQANAANQIDLNRNEIGTMSMGWCDLNQWMTGGKPAHLNLVPTEDTFTIVNFFNCESVPAFFAGTLISKCGNTAADKQYQTNWDTTPYYGSVIGGVDTVSTTIAVDRKLVASAVGLTTYRQYQNGVYYKTSTAMSNKEQDVRVIVAARSNDADDAIGYSCNDIALGEIMIYGHELSNAELAMIKAYIENKWSISL